MSEFSSKERHVAYCATLSLVEKAFPEDSSAWKQERKALALAYIRLEDGVIQAMYEKYATLPGRKGRP